MSDTVREHKYVGGCWGCTAPHNFFVANWDDVTPENQALIEAEGGLPCEGGGVIGWWCQRHRCSWHRELPSEECE